jgi:release factor glutamine methyltransferase
MGEARRPPAHGIGRLLDAAAADLAAMPQSDRALAGFEAQILLCLATGWSRTTLIAWPERRVPADALARFQALLADRLAGRPIAYLRGSQEFWGLSLRVTPDTLIPRPETELLVEIALELPDDGSSRWIADLGTGSGAVAAAIASERPHWEVIALDRSASTLAVAARNFQDLGLVSCHPVLADWLRPLAPGRLDLILANPPYVADNDPHLERGDLRFEPRRALAGGADGLDAIRSIAEQAPRCLAGDGVLAVEHGLDQGASVRRLFSQRGLTDIETRRDLAGHERVTRARRP